MLFLILNFSIQFFMFCWHNHGNTVAQHKTKGKQIKADQAQSSYCIGLD